MRALALALLFAASCGGAALAQDRYYDNNDNRYYDNRDRSYDSGDRDYDSRDRAYDQRQRDEYAYQQGRRDAERERAQQEQQDQGRNIVVPLDKLFNR